MVCYLVLIAGLVLLGPQNGFCRKGLREDYLSREHTDAVRGVFILLILASHFCNPLAPFTRPADIAYWAVRSALGQLVVVMFLFYSGYGMTESVRRKGRAYVRAIPRTRMLKLLFFYGLIQLVFIALRLLRHRPLPSLLRVFLALESIGSDNWYVCDILLCYAFTWLAFMLFPDREKPAAALVSVLCAALALFFRFRGYPVRWYNTLLCYPLGMWFSVCRGRIEALCREERRYAVVTLGCAALFCLAWRFRDRMWVYAAHACLFALLLVLLSMKLTLGNPFLRWCGQNLMGLFLVHRIPYRILRETAAIDNMYLRFAVFFLSTMLLTLVFGRIVKAVNRLPLFRQGERIKE